MNMDLGLRIVPAVAASAAVSFLAFRHGLLARSGAVAAFLLGSVVFGLGGAEWSVPLLVFFILSSLLSRYVGGRLGGRFDTVFEKGSTRDAGQVWANGGIAGSIVVVAWIIPSPFWFPAYVGALAAAAADTWGTESGILLGRRVFSVVTFRRVEPGISGGVSLEGSIGAAVGALTVAIGGGAAVGERELVPVALLAGLAGMFADSLAGAILQARYRCRVCGARTERGMHCGLEADLEHGFRRVGNDAVNTVCTLVGAAVAFWLASLFGVS